MFTISFFQLFCMFEKLHRKKLKKTDFPDGSVVMTLSISIRGVGSTPGWEAKILHASQPKNQNIKKREAIL